MFPAAPVTSTLRRDLCGGWDGCAVKDWGMRVLVACGVAVENGQIDTDCSERYISTHMSQRTPNKIAIIGAGGVGATVAYACMIRGIGKQFALYDIDAKKVKSQTLDLTHGLQFVPMASIEGSDDIAVCTNADVVVITAGAKQRPGIRRMDLAENNAEILKQTMPGLIKVAPNATILVVTNPVDVITYIALKLSGLTRAKVMGSGTVLDSSRFRFLIAKRLRIAVQNVHAYI